MVNVKHLTPYVNDIYTNVETAKADYQCCPRSRRTDEAESLSRSGDPPRSLRTASSLASTARQPAGRRPRDGEPVDSASTRRGNRPRHRLPAAAIADAQLRCDRPRSDAIYDYAPSQRQHQRPGVTPQAPPQGRLGEQLDAGQAGLWSSLAWPSRAPRSNPP